jgi:hypothetical protein
MSAVHKRGSQVSTCCWIAVSRECLQLHAQLADTHCIYFATIRSDAAFNRFQSCCCCCCLLPAFGCFCSLSLQPVRLAAPMTAAHVVTASSCRHQCINIWQLNHVNDSTHAAVMLACCCCSCSVQLLQQQQGACRFCTTCCSPQAALSALSEAPCATYAKSANNSSATQQARALRPHMVK